MTDETEIRELQQRALSLRRHIVSIASAQRSHLGGSMSSADLMAALFFRFLRFDSNGRMHDHFLLSKGHAVHVYHACMVELEQIAASELPLSGTSGSRLGGHPTLRAPGVEFATGSLGHALSVGVGIALAEALNQSDRRTVVLLGDGELQEGSVWEAAFCAPHFGLRNLIAIVDANEFQASGSTAEIMAVEPIAEKWLAFRWQVIEIDGHDMRAVADALDEAGRGSGPVAIVAHTVKGKGTPGVEGTGRAHYTRLTAEEAEETLAALSAAR
ncbi:MAG: transketolase [Chloroflexi bacterium]|nr:transketolase [Chloroflexota bacterium]